MQVEEYPKCEKMIQQCQVDTTACAEAQAECNAAQLGPYEATGLNPYDIREQCKVKPLCYDFSDVEQWLAQPAVLKALGVDTGRVSMWQSCNFEVGARVVVDRA